MNNDERRVVEAAVTTIGALPIIPERRLGNARVLRLLATATTMAILRKFEALPDGETIAEFGTALRSRFPDGAHLIDDDALTAIIRSAHGFDDAPEDTDPARVRLLLRLLPYALCSENESTQDELTSFVDDILAATTA